MENQMHIAIHRTYKDKKQQIYYTQDGINVHVVETPPKLLEGTEVRSTAVNAADIFFVHLVQEFKVKITYAHFHSTGIPVGTKPEDMVKLYWALPADLFREFIVRPDIAELRGKVAERDALVQFYGDALRKLLQNAKNGRSITEMKEKLDAMRDSLPIIITDKKGKEKRISLDEDVALCASTVRECQLFNNVAFIKGGWMWAAHVVALSGGIQRFPSVGSFWHYCGENVKDGKAVKRVAGEAVEFNPELRTANWINFEQAIIKHRSNPWRSQYDIRLEIEIDKNNKVVKDLQVNESQLKMRARRWCRKEILKRFWLACNGIEFVEGKPAVSLENHVRLAPLPSTVSFEA